MSSPTCSAAPWHLRHRRERPRTRWGLQQLPVSKNWGSVYSFLYFFFFFFFFLGTTIHQAAFHSHIPDCTTAASTPRRAAKDPHTEAHTCAKPGWGVREGAAPTVICSASGEAGRAPQTERGQRHPSEAHPGAVPLALTLFFPPYHPNAAK